MYASRWIPTPRGLFLGALGLLSGCAGHAIQTRFDDSCCVSPTGTAVSPAASEPSRVDPVPPSPDPPPSTHGDSSAPISVTRSVPAPVAEGVDGRHDATDAFRPTRTFMTITPAPEETFRKPLMATPLGLVPPSPEPSEVVQASDRRTVTTDPRTSTTKVPPAPCLPDLEDWRAAQEQRDQDLQRRIGELESQLTENEGQLAQMESSMQTSSTELAKIREELGFWKQEFTRLEELMQTQHQEDFAMLDRLSRQLGDMLAETLAAP